MTTDIERLANRSLPEDPFADAELIPAASSEASAGIKSAPECAEVPLSSVVEFAVARMTARARREERPAPVPWTSLADAFGGGLFPGLYVLVGNPKSGKTQLAVQLALHAATRGVGTLYVALELGVLDLVARVLGLLAGIRWSSLFLGNIDPDRIAQIAITHAAVVRDALLMIDTPSPLDWKHDDLRAAVKRLRDRHPDRSRPVLVVVDFLQLVGGDERDLRERIGKAAYQARQAVREFDAVVILLSSTARENYDKLDGDAKKGDSQKIAAKKVGGTKPHNLVGLGKESGEIEFAADGVLVLTRRPWEGDTPPEDGTHVRLAIAAIRAGTPRWIDLRFNGNEFREAPPEEPDQAHGDAYEGPR